MFTSGSTEKKRKKEEMTISPRKSSKKLKALNDAEAIAILDGEVFKGLLEEHSHILPIWKDLPRIYSIRDPL